MTRLGPVIALSAALMGLATANSWAQADEWQRQWEALKAIGGKVYKFPCKDNECQTDLSKLWPESGGPEGSGLTGMSIVVNPGGQIIHQVVVNMNDIIIWRLDFISKVEYLAVKDDSGNWVELKKYPNGYWAKRQWKD